MLSSAKIGRSSWRYYQHTVVGGVGEYYAEHGDTPGRWHGSGLVPLGLTSGAEVAERELEALFARAICPSTGEALGAGWGERSVTGYDLTFSAPKSVSALWALGDQATVVAVEAAHGAAVRAGLDYLQTHAGYSRRGRNGIEQITTAGYAAALYDHGTSRAGDPQLHTHALVVNKVNCVDRAWRTLDGYEIYHHKKSAGVLYQAALRAELTARLPVVFDPVDVNGQAELAGAPPELLAAWSTRTAAVMGEATEAITRIEHALDREVTGVERARIVKTAVLATRPPKPDPVPAADRRARWAAQAAGLGWDRDTLTATLTTAHAAAAHIAVGGRDTAITTPTLADPAGGPYAGYGQVLADAVTAAGRSKAIWSRADLLIQVATHLLPGATAAVTATGDGSAAGAAALLEALTDRALTRLDTGVVPLGPEPTSGGGGATVTVRASDARYASRELVETEARIIDRVITGGYWHPKRLHPAITDHLADPRLGLTREQQHAVVNLLASRDLVTVMVAPAGAGKTRTLGAAAGVWTGQHRAVITLGPSARAASELAAVTGTTGRTVASWLREQDAAYAREQQAGEQQAGGGPVIVIDEASMLSTTDLDRVTTHAGRLRARVVLVGDPAQIGAVNAPGGMLDLFAARLGPRVVELSELHRFTRSWEAAGSLRLRDGDSSVIGTYVEHGRVHPAPSAAEAADAVITRWQAARQAGANVLMLARSWTDVTALNTRARALAAAAGEVTGPDLLTVMTRSPSTHGHLEQRAWRAGDLLITRRNTRDISIGADRVRNGDRYQVLAASTDKDGNACGLVVADQAGRGTTTLPSEYLARHVEYGWASTIDGAQGATADIAILLARSGLDREHLYVAMTRGRDQNHVHTTPELDTGDAGPHHQPQPPGSTAAASAAATGRTRDMQVPGQLVLPDYHDAVEQLTRAVTSSGRERAAHSRLDPHLQTAREDAWSRDWDREHPTPPAGARPGPDYPKHRRHDNQLQDALGAEQHAHADAAFWSERVHDLTTALDRAPFYARTRRRDLSGQLADGRQRLYHAVTAWQAATGQVQHLGNLVETDRAQRDRDTVAARQQAHDAWATRPDTEYVDANTLTYPIGTWTGRDQRSQQQIDDGLWHTPTAPTPRHSGPAHVLER